MHTVNYYQRSITSVCFCGVIPQNSTWCEQRDNLNTRMMASRSLQDVTNEQVNGDKSVVKPMTRRQRMLAWKARKEGKEQPPTNGSKVGKSPNNHALQCHIDHLTHTHTLLPTTTRSRPSHLEGCLAPLHMSLHLLLVLLRLQRHLHWGGDVPALRCTAPTSGSSLRVTAMGAATTRRQSRSQRQQARIARQVLLLLPPSVAARDHQQWQQQQPHCRQESGPTAAVCRCVLAPVPGQPLPQSPQPALHH